MGKSYKPDYNMEDTARLMTKAPGKHKGLRITLICLLILVLLGAGGLAVWKFVLGNDIGIGGKDPWIKAVEDYNEAVNNNDYEKKWEMAYPLLAGFYESKDVYLDSQDESGYNEAPDYKIKSIETVGNYSGREEIQELLENDDFIEECILCAIDQGLLKEEDITEIYKVMTVEEYTEDGVQQTESYIYYVAKIGNEWAICSIDVP